MSLKVLIPGALTTVQDLGRMGYQQSGIPCGGVMDRDAYAAANALAGNTAGEGRFGTQPYTAAAISLSQMRQPFSQAPI